MLKSDTSISLAFIRHRGRVTPAYLPAAYQETEILRNQEKTGSQPDTNKRIIETYNS